MWNHETQENFLKCLVEWCVSLTEETRQLTEFVSIGIELFTTGLLQNTTDLPTKTCAVRQ